jgi:hypothetical protein
MAPYSRSSGSIPLTSSRIALVVVALLGVADLVGAHGEDPTAGHGPATPAIEFRNGRWYDGRGFAAGAFYAVDGRLTRRRPAGALAVVDLRGGYVVPPYGEAHNHNIEASWNVDEVIARYLRDGVFYVRITGDIAELADAIRDRINQPGSVDVVFAHAGLTGRGGWPSSLYRDVLRPARYEPVLGPLSPEWFDNRAYYAIESREELGEKWAKLIASRPDFVKVYLECSEGFPTGDAVCAGRSGLDPRLLSPVVHLARRAGLTVTAHVLTAADFRAAVDAGVTDIAHVPGWLLLTPAMADRARLSGEDATLAAQRGTRVTTTTVASRYMGQFRTGPWAEGRSGGGHGVREGSDHLAPGGAAHRPGERGSHGSATSREAERAERAVAIANLRLLRRHGVTVLIGSDHADTSLAEALNLHDTGVFTNAELLKMWSETTPRAIFADRRIGRLAEGFEATFLVLAGNPITDFRNVQRIRLRVKAGRVLDPV